MDHVETSSSRKKNFDYPDAMLSITYSVCRACNINKSSMSLKIGEVFGGRADLWLDITDVLDTC